MNYIPRFQVPRQPGHWFVYQCPNTADVLYIDPDSSKGLRRPSAGQYVHPCHICQTHHKFDSAEIRSIVVEPELSH